MVPELEDPADLLVDWSRRFLSRVHHDAELHRAGLLIGAQAEVLFWPFPELGSLDGLAAFLEQEVVKAREQEPEAIALVLPLAPDDSAFGITEERDYDLLVIAVDAHHHCASLVSPVSIEGDQVRPHGWQDLVGYVPSLAPFLYAAFAELKTPRPQDDMEWALVEGAHWRDAELPGLAVACACELAYRRSGEPERELAGALAGRPADEGFRAIVAEAERLRHVYAGYLREVAPDAQGSLAKLTEPQLSQLFFSSLVELRRRELFDEPGLTRAVPRERAWTHDVRPRLEALGERPS